MSEQPTRYGAQIDAALTLLDTGRVQMARTVLEGLTQQITGEMLHLGAASYEEGCEAGRLDLAREIVGDAKPVHRLGSSSASWLAALLDEAVADAQERVP